MASRFQRSALAVALVGFMAAASVLVLRARPEPFGKVPTLPPMGWYVVSDTPATGIEDDAVLLGTAQTWAETARQAGYDDVRVFPQPQSGGSCFTGPDDGSETEGGCSLATPAFGYVVVLRGPLSPPPTLDSDTKFEWYKQTWEEERQRALSRSFPHEVSLSPLPFPTRIADDTGSVPVIEGAAFVDGWYLAVTPGDLTTDDGMALTAARAMAVGAQQAGYDEVRIVHWPQGPGPCDPWDARTTSRQWCTSSCSAVRTRRLRSRTSRRNLLGSSNSRRKSGRELRNGGWWRLRSSCRSVSPLSTVREKERARRFTPAHARRRPAFAVAGEEVVSS